MEKIIEILNKNEENIIAVLINKAKQGEYTRYTSTRMDDWVLSVRGITKGIENLFKAQERTNFLHVDGECECDETVAFGIKEAKLHRARGVTLSMFLGLIKYYRQSYIVVLESVAELNEVEKKDILSKINLYFDRFEIGFCSEWSNISKDSRVSQLQEVNRILTNEKNKFHTIFQSMAEPVIVVDAKRRIREINNAAVKCFNLDYKNVIGKPCYEIFRCCHELDECPLKRAMREASQYDNLEISIDINNHLRKFLVSGSFLEDISGKFAGGVELFIDVTESRENELKLLKARNDADLEAAKLRAMISGMGEGVVFADAGDRIIEVNDFFLNYIAGCSRSELLGKSIWDFHAGDLLGEVRNLINSFKTKSYSSHVSVTRRIRELEMIMRVQPIYSNGLYQGVLLNAIDVTELSRARIEAERAKEQAESANRAKSDFLAVMSHEIRTPMNGILGFAEILLNQALSSEQKESVQAISLCGEQLLDLINEILDLSKIESGKMVLEETDFSLENIIKDVITTVRQKAQDKGLEIRVNFLDDIPQRFIGDSIRIRQILSNLLFNAVKFTMQGSVIISVSKRQEECHERDDIFPLQIEVADTGIGISQDKRELIFDAFTQAEGVIAQKFGGSGLGLTICRSLLDLMGGEIWVNSNKPQGTIFTFCLPVKIHFDGAKESNNFENESVSDGATILVVEDDRVARQIIKIHLRKAGYNVISTASGKEAITCARHYHPHGVILDLLLPDLSGWQVLQELKKSEITREIPVIICSILPEKEKAISLGAVDYIEKPVREKTLLEKVRKHVSLQMCGECHIVLVDDEQVVLDYLSVSLGGNNYILHLFSDAKDALIYLLTGGYAHAIILDLPMPGMDSFDFLNRLRANQQTAKIPVLINTAKELTPGDFKQLNGKYQAILEKSSLEPKKLVQKVAQLVYEYTATSADIESDGGESGKKAYNILVAEDHILNQKIIESFLVTEGHRVTMVKDGAEVLHALKSNNFDLILMDMQMPTMDGYETMARIRAEKKWGSMPIVAITAYAMKGDEEKCFEAGCNYYLSKPIRKADLISLIDRITLSGSENKNAKMDMEYLQEIRHLIPFFIDSVEQEINKALIALEKGDFSTIEYIGHGLKGSCGAYGFHELSELGEEMERSSIDEDYKTLVISVDRFRMKIHDIKDAVLAVKF
ncbi:multi-sensor hybrid histidine kinase [Desulfofarcimen acetoxidans DSM 771]|uniref:Circadian input-output histidine kinase CikA n=1 Tax=Desulfofarcimen acetoxidans (strain ATCC 49208 / DSM 771 / KCTC 5769 / VKM B-1644 / 5575) TaxID=485916 RepID=C8VW65_DESAS|nr:response regulator [Desulfofarcimen acetoxidans]ACV62417.1 multi-sensor hybrid histidine kinase [Desulfofarcimen acetoxidans DSM 771]